MDVNLKRNFIILPIEGDSKWVDGSLMKDFIEHIFSIMLKFSAFFFNSMCFITGEFTSVILL